MPIWYMALMVILSGYQACRGFKLYDILGIHRSLSTHIWSRPEIVWLLCVADAITYFICTAGGFVALYWAYSFARVRCVQEISSGTSVLLIFLGLVGILGITGKLPTVLDRARIGSTPP